MADKRLISKLDKKLVEQGIVAKEYLDDLDKVHQALNNYSPRGKGTCENDHMKDGEDALRDWLMILHKQNASKEKIDSYFKAGLAHLCFDFISSSNKDLSVDEIVTRSLMSFSKRGYAKKNWKPRPTKQNEKITPGKKQ